MSQPAFQLIDDRFGTAAPFGTAAYGTTPYGGEDWAPAELPRIHMTSENLTRLLSRRVADIVHTRQGQPVSVRPFSSWGIWRVAFVAITEAQLDVLWVFCQARVFKLLPAGDAGSFFTVYWTNQEFRPEFLGNGLYNLTFEIQEVAT